MSDIEDGDNVVQFPPPPPTGEPDDKKKRVANPLNLRRELQGNALTKGLVGFDEFAQQIVLLRPVPRPGLKGPKKFDPRPWADADDTALAEHLNSRGFRRVGSNLIREVVSLEARSNPFHPVRQYLDNLKWDGVERMSRFLFDYCGAVTAFEDDECAALYIEAISRAFFVSAVARIFSPGCKADSMLIIEGLQGALKSAMLRSLAVRDEWFTDSLPHDLSSKDARAHLAGRWIIEMGEIAQFKRSEIETVKSFLSCQIDRFRPPYGRSDISVPRQCICVGTTNATTYLHDPTGNRRFWPVKITAIQLDKVREDVGKLWAEAVAAFKAGERWWLSADNEGLAADEQQFRTERDPWHDAIQRYVAQQDGRYFTTARVLTELEVEQPRRDRAHEMRVGSVLRLLGCERKRIMISGERKYVYFQPGKKMASPPIVDDDRPAAEGEAP